MGHKNHEEAHAVLEKDRIQKFVEHSLISSQSCYERQNYIHSKAIKTLTEKDIASVAARLFVQNGFQLKKEFQNAAAKHYGAPAEKVDFSNAEKCAAAINGWVAENTKNMIQELFSAGDIGQ